MELTNEFRVGVPVEDAWAVLTDVERIAPCLPGAQLQEVEGDVYRGIVKVKVGPITASYKGTATFVEKDDVAHRAVLRAEGRDTRGQGNANATVTATLQADGDGTAVKVATDLTITGKVAQFGRGVLADVSGKLIGQFVENLERDVLSGDGGNAASATPAPASTPAAGSEATTATAIAPVPAAAPAMTPDANGAATSGGPATNGAGASGPAASTVRKLDMPEPEPVDLFATAGSPIAKRAIPVVVLVVLAVLVLRRRRRRA